MRVSKKEKILDVAARYFSKYGYANAVLDDIAAEVGITKPAIYYHFKDKSDLYAAVLIGRLKRLADAVEAGVKGVEKPCEALDRYIVSFGEFLNENSCFAAILAHEFADDGANMPEDAARQLARTLGLLTEILDRGIAKEAFEIENPMVIQLTIVSSLVMHQTTEGLRRRVTGLVGENHTVRPEPDMRDLARILAKKVVKAVKRPETMQGRG